MKSCTCFDDAVHQPPSLLSDTRVILFVSLFLMGLSGANFAVDDGALPQGGTVVSGSASISRNQSSMTINQSSQNASLNWDSFDIGRNASVNFEQPNASSVAVNRISSANGSQIMGNLTSNGNVFLINPNGVLFGENAQINVGGLVASTLNIDDAMLGGDTLRFADEYGVSDGSIINYGDIQSRAGGYVALLGRHVANHGIIEANMGTVAMGAGEEATLSFAGNQLLSLTVDKGVVDALADNSGLIQANGGQVYMTAKAANELTTAVVNHSGVIEAQTMVEREGRIILLGDMETGTTYVNGVLDASAPERGNGGFIETSAGQVKVESGAVITTAAVDGNTGEWLVDPNDYTIAASGGDITGAALATALSSSNVTLESVDGATGTDGDIFVNDSVSWSSGNSLTLSAYRNIDINQAVSSTGGGDLVLRSGTSVNGVGTVNFGAGGSILLSGGGAADIYYNPTSYAAPTNFSANITGTHRAWMLINNVTQLQNMSSNLSGRYALAGDIDASATATMNAGAGFDPIGSATNRFVGDFDGQNYTITSLTINRPTEDQVGLFGYADTGSTISNAHMAEGTGSITGRTYVGSFAAFNAGTMSNLSSDLDVTGQQSFVGGLVGFNYSSISDSYATGTINAVVSNAGGLIGYNSGGAISQSFASGDVTSPNYSGGLIGSQVSGSILNSYASGSVHADTSFAGGLVGFNDSNGSITRSYASGAVTGGGGATNINGLVGRAATGSFTDNFYDTTTTGQAAGSTGITAGITGMTTAEMQTLANFNSATAANGSSDPTWDLDSVWRVYDGNTLPLLRSFLTDITVTADSVTRTYDGSAYGGSYSATQSDPMVTLSGTLAFSTSGVNAGTYAITPSGLYSTGQFGYDITFADGTQTIDPVALSIAGSSVADRTYDASTSGSVTAGALSGFVGAETVNVSGTTGTFADANVGTVKNVTVTYTLADGLNGGLANNYTLADEVLTADITAAAITVSTSDVSRTYDGTTAAAGTAVLSSGTLFGTDAIDAGAATYTFDNANAGTGKSVTVSGVAVTDGNGGNNYAITYADNTSSTINAAAITVSTSDVSRTYDGTTVAAGTAVLSSGTLYGADALDDSGAAYAFADANAGTGKSVTVSGVSVSDGNGGNNYTINYLDNTSSTISAAPITVTSTSVGRIYDGTTSAPGSATVSSGALFGTDTLDASGATYTFDDANVGNGKSVSVTGVNVSDGNGGNNYTVTYVDNTSSTISAAPITISTNDVSRTYDGTTAAVGGAMIASGSLFGSDSLDSTGATYTFDDADVGTGKTVSVSGVSVNDGNGGSNYSISFADNTSSTISAAPITITTTDVSRTYDGTTAAVGTTMIASGSLFGSDALDSSAATYTFDDANAGTGKTVSVADVSINDGNGGNNYLISFADNTSSTINAAPITVTTSDVSRTYDGTTAAAGAVTIANGSLFGADALDGSLASYVFEDANAGTGKTVTVSGVSVNDGNGGNNYTVSYLENTSSSISAAPITITSTDVVRTYDGTTNASGSAAISSGTLFGTDTLDMSGVSYTFDDANVGTGKTVTISGVGVSDGNGGNNYTLSFVDNNSSTINQAPLTVTAIGGSKVYDGVEYTGGFGVTYSGFVGGEDLSVVSGTVEYSGSAQSAVNAGSYQIDVQGFSADNYAITYEAGQLDILPAQLVYFADSAVAFTGQELNLSGSVDGLAASDNLGDVISGTVSWSTSASLDDGPGNYDIIGDGISVLSSNYLSTIEQADGNVGALTLLSPAVVVAETVNQVIRDEEEELSIIGYANEIFVDDNRKIIFDIDLENQGMRLPAGLKPLRN